MNYKSRNSWNMNISFCKKCGVRTYDDLDYCVECSARTLLKEGLCNSMSDAKRVVIQRNRKR